MRKKRKKRRVVFILIFFLLIACGILYFLLFKFNAKDSKILGKIEGYGYTIENRDTDLMKEVFFSLNDELKKDPIDDEKYAEYLSKLFVIDLYTLKNKVNKYDVGSVEYIYPGHRDNFKLKVQDSLYKYLEEKSGRNQKLPVVTEVIVDNLKHDTYKYGGTEYFAYTLDISWDYSKDLGYDTKGTITLIKDNNILYVAEFTPEVIK